MRNDAGRYRRLSVIAGKSIAAMTTATLAFSTPAYAATCSMAAVPTAFGIYNAVTRDPVNTTATITVTCSDIFFVFVTYSITVSPGQSGNAASRYLSSGQNKLNYQMYVDSARTRVAGDGSAGTSTVPGSNGLLTGLGSASRTETLYSTIFGKQAAAPGVYSDTVTLQITY